MAFLMALFLVPFFSSLIIFLQRRGSQKFLRGFSFILSLIPLLILLIGIRNWIGKEVSFNWFPALAIHFHLKVDALSLIFLFLTNVIIPISLFPAVLREKELPNLFFSLVLFLQGLFIGFFTAADLVVFTFFWEAMIVPMYFIISLWGKQGCRSAASKFLIYMVAGSVLMIAGVLSLYFLDIFAGGTGTFQMEDLKKIPLSSPIGFCIFAIFTFAFAVKTPLFPFHAWLPDAYCLSSTSGTIILSSLLSKAGIYGVIRILMGIFPEVMQLASEGLLALAIIGSLYGAFAAWMQNDFKRLVAYSSLSHVNIILVGLFAMNWIAASGGILQSINHALTIAALFLAAGWLEERIGSTKMDNVSGLTHYLPRLSWLTLFFVLSSVGLPGLNNFVGEILIFFGFFKVSHWQTVLIVLTVILSVVYMLRWMQKVYFSSPTPYVNSFKDLKVKELLHSAPLIALIIWIGIYPHPLLSEINKIAKVFYVNGEEK